MPSAYKNRRTEDMIEEFVREYKRIDNCSSKRYNLLKSEGVPTWECITRRLNIARWSDLCRIANVDYKYGSKTNRLPIVVTSRSQTEQKLEEINKKYKKLIDDIKNK